MKTNTEETKYFDGCRVTLHWNSIEGSVDIIPYYGLHTTALADLIKYLHKGSDTYFSYYKFVLKAFGTTHTLCDGLIDKLTFGVIEFFLTSEPHIKVNTVSVFDGCLYIELKIKS